MRWFAVIPLKSFVHEILPMQKDGEMDRLMSNPATCDIVGIPAYYDAAGRVWPFPIDGCIIAKSE